MGARVRSARPTEAGSIPEQISKSMGLLVQVSFRIPFSLPELPAGHAQIHTLATTATQYTLRVVEIAKIALGRLIPAAAPSTYCEVITTICRS
jgi:hypothetical protein